MHRTRQRFVCYCSRSAVLRRAARTNRVWERAFLISACFISVKSDSKIAGKEGFYKKIEFFSRSLWRRMTIFFRCYMHYHLCSATTKRNVQGVCFIYTFTQCPISFFTFYYFILWNQVFNFADRFLLFISGLRNLDNFTRDGGEFRGRWLQNIFFPIV